MKCVEDELLKINSNSINKARLHHRFQKELVASVKDLALLSADARHKAVADLFRQHLQEEIVKSQLEM